MNNEPLKYGCCYPADRLLRRIADLEAQLLRYSGLEIAVRRALDHGTDLGFDIDAAIEAMDAET
jgi:hypothetical protein